MQDDNSSLFMFIFFKIFVYNYNTHITEILGIQLKSVNRHNPVKP